LIDRGIGLFVTHRIASMRNPLFRIWHYKYMADGEILGAPSNIASHLNAGLIFLNY
jgi:hypothetical protein